MADEFAEYVEWVDIYLGLDLGLGLEWILKIMGQILWKGLCKIIRNEFMVFPLHETNLGKSHCLLFV